MNLDEFLGHSSTSRGGSKFANWRKRQPPQIDTWLHVQSSIVALWRHGWPRLVEIDRDGEKVTEVWGGNFNCWEPEDVLKRQYRRNDDGSRVAPPTICPHCLLLEYLRGMVRAEKLSWTEPVFRFEGDDPQQAQVLTVGGLYNGFSGELSRQQVAELRRAGIRRDEAWKENTMAKCSYVFSIVDHVEPEKGVQIAIETTALGDAVKRVIRDQIDALGAAEGHPLKNPYAIRWQYRPTEQEFSKKYHALAMPKLQLTPEIRELIFDAAPPDLSGIIGRGNVASLRSTMEAHALIELPFDKLFAAAEEAEGVPAPQEGAPNRASARSTGSKPKPAAPPPADEEEAPKAPPARRQAKPKEPEGPVEPVRPAGTVTLPCDACGATMGETEDTCWKCGAKYELDDAPPAPAKATKAAPAPMREPGDDTDDDVGF